MCRSLGGLSGTSLRKVSSRQYVSSQEKKNKKLFPSVFFPGCWLLTIDYFFRGFVMSTEHSHHTAAPDPRLEKHLSSEQTQALEERVKKLEALLVAKGFVSPATLEKMVEIYEKDLGPMNGAKVVAHAWIDPGYKQRLLSNATAAIAELGFGGLQGEHMVVVENNPSVHNVVACSLCSCYPWPVLGLPPTWYKNAPYRSRIVID